MEFNQKLQELRKQYGMTQEELAEALHVSRTAVSKWESGRGYPNIESLKDIAKFFSVTVDELISPDQVIELAEEDRRTAKNQTGDLVFGLLDICSALLIFLPFFASRVGDAAIPSSLLTLDGVQPYLRILYFVIVLATIACGIMILALQNCSAESWVKSKRALSFVLSGSAVLLFILSLQPYASIFVLTLLAVKAVFLSKHH